VVLIDKWYFTCWKG